MWKGQLQHGLANGPEKIHDPLRYGRIKTEAGGISSGGCFFSLV